MDRAALIAAWLDLFGTPVPRGLSRTFLRRFLAMEVQTRRTGGLSRQAKSVLAKIDDQVPQPKTASLQPGGRLLREWNGVTHVVDVTGSGYEWKGQTWRSLSAIAREITGAHWSGPRFFGLAVNAAEASVVRQIFDLYVTHKCLGTVTREATEAGLRSKRHVFASGRRQGGTPFSRGQIHKLLTNTVYLGLIRHKEKIWPGMHPAIVDQDVWDRVQSLLQAASAKRRGTPAGSPGSTIAPLKGKFRDETGDLLPPSHTRRRSRRLRYYLSNRLISGGADARGWRLFADAFEAAVVQAIADHLASFARRHDVLSSVEAASAASASDTITALVDRLRSGSASAAAALIIAGEIGGGRIRIDLDRTALAAASGLPAGELSAEVLAIDCAFRCRRRGVEMKIVAGDLAPRPDPTLIRGLRHAHRWSAALKSGTPLGKLAACEGFSERYMARVIRLTGLSPRIQEVVLRGLQPVDLTLERLLRSRLPLDWSEQEEMLGMADRRLP